LSIFFFITGWGKSLWVRSGCCSIAPNICLPAWLDLYSDWTIADSGRIPNGGEIVPREHVHIGSWAHPGSYPIGIGRGTVSPEGSGCGVKLTTHLHLVQKLRMRGALSPIPYTSSWRVHELWNRINLYVQSSPNH
jgi:hypothetical protein